MSIVIKIAIALSVFMPLALQGAVGAPMEYQYNLMFENDPDLKKEFFSIIKSDLLPTPYENILLTKLRDKETSLAEFRFAAKRIAYNVLQKAICSMKINDKWIHTSLALVKGHEINDHVELVSLMRGGDIFVNSFIDHFPCAGVSKYLVYRDAESEKSLFKYKKVSNTLYKADTVIILEPLVATGSTLAMVIIDLEQYGIMENQIVIASLLVSPEAVAYLSKRFPNIRLVTCAVDERINEHKFIMPGLGDFADRYYGTD